MIRRWQRTCLPAVALTGWLWGGAALAAGSCPDNLEPARFGAGSESLNTLIRYPGARAGSPTALRCDLSVLKSGVAVFGACQRPGGELEIFEAAVEAAVEAARFLPATANGRPLRTVLQVTVVFRGPGDTFVLPHAGQMFSQFGNAYVAPQRIINAGERWRPLRLDIGSRDLSLDYQGFVEVDVDARGQVTGVDLDLDREVTRDVRAGLVRRFENVCFVPGLTRNGPTPMRYRELVWE